MVEYAHGVLGDRLHIVTAGDQISNDEPELDCLTLLKPVIYIRYNIHHKYYLHIYRYQSIMLFIIIRQTAILIKTIRIFSFSLNLI